MRSERGGQIVRPLCLWRPVLLVRVQPAIAKKKLTCIVTKEELLSCDDKPRVYLETTSVHCRPKLATAGRKATLGNPEPPHGLHCPAFSGQRAACARSVGIESVGCSSGSNQSAKISIAKTSIAKIGLLKSTVRGQSRQNRLFAPGKGF